MKRLTLLLACVSYFSLAYSQDELQVKRIADDVMKNSTAYDNLRVLCKTIGPRLSGSVNAARAVQLGMDMMRAAGADTVWLQPCMVPHWERGKKESGTVSGAGIKPYRLRLAALGNSVGTGPKAVRAQVIEVRSMADLHAKGNQLKGKIVFVNIPMNPLYIRTFQAYGESGIGRRSGASQAAKYGALAVMVRSLASNIDSFPHTGVLQYNDSFPKIPAVAVSTLDAEWLSKTLASTTLTATLQTNCRMLPDEPSFNVIGELRGKDKPGEIITVGGHLDSWDLAEGAHDDGTGCMQSIEVLASLHRLGIRPLRTVRAVLFMNEENGGRGSDAYLQSAKLKNEQHIFALESDAGGFTPRGFGLDMTTERMEKIKSWAPLFRPYGVTEIEKGGGGSDIGPLKSIGASLAGFMPDSQRYFDLHHASNDRFEAVSKRELDLGIVNMTALIWLVSEYGL